MLTIMDVNYTNYFAYNFWCIYSTIFICPPIFLIISLLFPDFFPLLILLNMMIKILFTPTWQIFKKFIILPHNGSLNAFLQRGSLLCWLVKEFESIEKTYCAAADDGCTSSTDLQVLHQHGNSLHAPSTIQFQ